MQRYSYCFSSLLSKLNHPNIVGFRGLTKTAEGVDTLALEMCSTSLGSILEERHDEDLGPLPAKHTFKMIMDIAQALDFLHTEARLLHGDLKSFNVLVKGEFEICKLCDFGVTMSLDENGEINFHKNPQLEYVGKFLTKIHDDGTVLMMMMFAGTTLWSAPEIIDQMEVIDSKADIFSFGLIIYETLALVPPHMLGLEGNFDVSSDMDTSTASTIATGTEAEAGGAAQELQRKKLNYSNNDESAVANESIDNVDEDDNDDENDMSDFSLSNIEQAYGTRPPLPVAFQLSDEYNCIVELFYLCTNALSEDRPAARTIWQCFENNAANVAAAADAASD